VCGRPSTSRVIDDSKAPGSTRTARSTTACSTGSIDWLQLQDSELLDGLGAAGWDRFEGHGDTPDLDTGVLASARAPRWDPPHVRAVV